MISIDEDVVLIVNGGDILDGFTSLNGSFAHSCNFSVFRRLCEQGAVTADDSNLASFACSASVCVANLS
jgi:hypothetical protein